MRINATKPDVVREITLFALRRRGKSFEGWRPEIVFKFFAFHLLAGTLFLVREGRAILGVGIGYPCHASYLREHEGQAFSWTLPPPGDTLFIGDVIACRRALPALLKMALDKWPWISRVAGYRHGHLKEIHLKAMARLVR